MINKDELKRLLSQNNTGQVIEKLISFDFKDLDLQSESIALSARYKKYIKEMHSNITNPVELNIEINKINSALLHLIDKINNNNIQGGSKINDWKINKTNNYQTRRLDLTQITIIFIIVASLIYLFSKTIGVTGINGNNNDNNSIEIQK